jgi:hypothetical protein
MIEFLLDRVVAILLFVIGLREFVLLVAVALVARWVCDKLGIPRILPEGTAGLIAMWLFLRRVKDEDAA